MEKNKTMFRIKKLKKNQTCSDKSTTSLEVIASSDHQYIGDVINIDDVIEGQGSLFDY